MNLEMAWPYLALPVVAVVWHLWQRGRKERAHAHQLGEAVAAGLNEPPSLHPVVDPARCIGSGSCVKVCPEHALGMVNGKATLINASACIGHGACHAACPFDAISLVFGTEKRGVDIPLVRPNFETNIPGIFIAGELGGMGLIRKAAEQGRQAMDAVALRGRDDGADALDVVIIGAGPAGLSAGLSAIERGLRYRIVEQESSLGGSIFHYPRQKVAMTAPVQLALVGQVKMHEISKERLLEFWHGVMLKFKLVIQFGERMESIVADGNGFIVTTSRSQHRARCAGGCAVRAAASRPPCWARRQQALGALGLGEGDHVADRLGLGHQRDEAVQAEGQAAVRRRAVLQRVEQEAELDLRVFRRNLQRLEHLALHLGAVDPHRAAAQLPAVEHHVVGLGDAGTGVGVHQVLVAILGRGEGVVHGVPAVAPSSSYSNIGKSTTHSGAQLVLEQAGASAELAVADLHAQRADGVVDDLGLVGAEEDQVAVAAPVRAMISAMAASCRFFTMGDCRPSRPLPPRR
jgi:ferredoxin